MDPVKTSESSSSNFVSQDAMILHVISLEKFIAPYIDFLENTFADFNRHVFFCMGDEKRFPVRRRPNTIFTSDLESKGQRCDFEINRNMYKANKIFLHNLFDNRVVQMLALQPWLLKKCFWVIWGADLYSYKFAKRTWRWRFDEVLRRIVIRHMGNLVTYVEGDVELARKWYGARGRYHECLMYPSNLYKNYAVPARSESTINIQLGNSADPRNEHFEMLEMLEPYRDEDIKIYCILSYGPEEHAVKVAEAGKKRFGEKFIAVTEFVDETEYVEFLGNIDIAVFNHRRQQAMGNIITLLGMGKKVYLRTDVSSWNVFKTIGVKLFNVTELTLEPIALSTKVKNRQLIKSKFSSLKLWEGLRDIFEA